MSLKAAPKCQEATRVTAPAGGGGPVKLHASRPCPLLHCRDAVSANSENRAVIEMTLAIAPPALETRFDPLIVMRPFEKIRTACL